MAPSKKMSWAEYRQPEVLLDLNNQFDNENARNEGLSNRPSDDGKTQGATTITLASSTCWYAQRMFMSVLTTVAIVPSTTTVSERLADAQTQSIFFKLPAEVREMIYEYILSTKTENDCTSSRVIVLKEHFASAPWDLRRKHDYHCRGSFDFTQLSILGTCHEIRREAMRLFWPTTVFRFEGIQSLMRFVGIQSLNGSNKDLAQQNITILRKAQKIECNVTGKIFWDFYSLEEVAEQLESPLDLEMIDCTTNKGDAPTQAQLEAGEFWQGYMMELETKILAKQWFMTLKDDKRSVLQNEPTGRLDSLLPDFLQ